MTRKKPDKVAELGRAMTDAAAWSEGREVNAVFITLIQDEIAKAMDDLLSREEIVEAGARQAVFDGLEDNWIEGSGIEESRLALSRRSLRNHLQYAQGWFEDRAALYLALAKELKWLRRNIPVIARRAPGGVRQDESLKEAIDRAASASDLEARVIAAWSRSKGELP